MDRRVTGVAATTLTVLIGCTPGGPGINRNLKPSPLPDGANSNEVAECERRMRMMRQQDADSRAHPDEIADSARYAGRPAQDFPDEDNPCRKAASDSGEEDLTEAEQELKDRQFAKVRARTMLDSARPGAARDALRGAFGVLTPEDDEVATLTRAVAAAYLRVRRQDWADSGRLGVVTGEAPGCVFSLEPLEGLAEAERAQFSFSEPVTNVHVACALPADAATLAKAPSALVLRRRVGATRYVDVDRVDLGELGAYTGGGLARGVFEVRLPAGAVRAYYDAALHVDGVPEAERELASDGFFVVLGQQ